MPTKSETAAYELKNLIAQNQNDRVFKELIKIIIKNNSLKKYENELILLQNNYDDFMQKNRLGLALPQELKNSIIIRLLDLIDRVEGEDSAALSNIYEEYRDIKQKKNIKFAIEISGSVLVFSCTLILAPSIFYALGALILIALFFTAKSYFDN